MPDISMTYASISPPLPVQPGLPPALNGTGITLPNAAKAQQGQPVAVALLPNDTSPDELSQLLPFIISNNNKTISCSFPGVEFKEQFTNDLAIYKYPNRDGAKIDNLGANPQPFTIRAILTNNIFPGDNEKWVHGQLFTSVYNQLLNLLKDSGSYKILQHPLRGDLTVQVIGYETNFDAKGPRDGAYVDIHLIQTIVNQPATLTLPLGIVSAGRKVSIALEAVPLGPPSFPPPPGLSFANFFNRLSALVQNIVNTPTDIVEALADDTLIEATAIQGFFPSIAQGFDQSLASLDQTANALFSLFKPAPLGSPLAVTTASPTYTNQFQGNLVPNTFPQAYSIGDAAALATRNLVAFNSNRSKNAYDFLGKAQTCTKNLVDYYTAMNRVEVSDVINALTNFLYTLQQTQATIQNNVTNTSQTTKVGVSTYLTKTFISWYGLSRLLNNDVNDLFSLNQGMDMYYIPNNTLINYFQSA